MPKVVCCFQLMQGNSDRDSIVIFDLVPAVLARYIRINPQSWFGGISLRLELIGCTQAEQKYCKYKDGSAGLDRLVVVGWWVNVGRLVVVGWRVWVGGWWWAGGYG